MCVSNVTTTGVGYTYVYMHMKQLVCLAVRADAGAGRKETLTRWRAPTYLFGLWQDVAQSTQLLGAERLAVATRQVRHHLRRRDAKLTQEDVHLETLLVLKQRNLSTQTSKNR